jgi:hypothetical protein
MGPNSSNHSDSVLSAEAFGLPEDEIAQRVGISRKDVAGRRGPQGERWEYGPNRRVLWSQAGLEELKRELAPESAPEKNGAPVSPLAVLTVWMTRFENRRVLLAYRAQPEERLTVYLGFNGDNTRFLPGMKLLARPWKGAAWIFEGNPEAPDKGRRMPRVIGRW